MSYNLNLSPDSSGSDYLEDPFSFGQPAAQATKQPLTLADKSTIKIPNGLIPFEIFNIEFRIDARPIAKGGFGVVSTGIYLPTGDQVAIKKVDGNTNPKNPSWGHEEIMREIHLTKSLDSRHLCKIYAYTVDEFGFIYIIMEIIDGLEAFDFFSENRVFLQKNPRVIKMMIRDITEGLANLHDSGLVHRDIKSTNIMFQLSPGQGKSREFIRAVIIDFGLIIQSKEIPIGSRMGTLDYCSPEMAIGKSKLTCQIDMWSLGVIIYEILFRTYPFPDLPAKEVLTIIANLKTHPQLPPYIGDDEDIKDLRRICERCFEPNPIARITSAQLLEELTLSLGISQDA
jgi:serine/threonine protein kinase